MAQTCTQAKGRHGAKRGRLSRRHSASGFAHVTAAKLEGTFESVAHRQAVSLGAEILDSADRHQAASLGARPPLGARTNVADTEVVLRLDGRAASEVGCSMASETHGCAP